MASPVLVVFHKEKQTDYRTNNNSSIRVGEGSKQSFGLKTKQKAMEA